MFSEILRIKPVLDPATSKKMEASLSTRFRDVARKFGRGLKNVIRGSVIGISLGLLSQLLNPLEALEEKIKTLLGQGRDLNDLAEKFGAAPSELKELQDVAQSLGLEQTELTEMISTFAKAIETARDELLDPNKEKSETTKAVQEFTDEASIVKSFKEFLKSLKAEGLGEGRTINLGNGVTKRLTGAESRRDFEKKVFGEAQTGAARRLIESDPEIVARSLGLPSAEKYNKALEKLSDLDLRSKALEVQRTSEDFLASTDKMSKSMIDQLAARDKKALEESRKDFDKFDELMKAAGAIEEIKNDLKIIYNLILKGVSYLGEFNLFIKRFAESSWLKRLIGGK